MKKGFTLLELIIVIIIIGILGALGFVQYTRMVEKGRTAEGKDVLGQVRTAEEGYRQEYGTYTATLGNLAIDVPTSCTTSHYFSFSASVAGLGTATRCTTNGKSPNASAAYNIVVNFATGAWSGSAGYF